MDKGPSGLQLTQGPLSRKMQITHMIRDMCQLEKLYLGKVSTKLLFQYRKWHLFNADII